jgi:hypothetical protein
MIAPTITPRTTATADIIMNTRSSLSGVPAGMSPYAVELAAPDITPYRKGNTGIEYVTTFDSGKPGPHAMVMRLRMVTRFAVPSLSTGCSGWRYVPRGAN